MVQLLCRRHRFPAEIIQHAIWLFIMSMISSALFIDGKLDRQLANRRAKTTVFQSSRKYHIRHMLTLPERTPQFTVMRAVKYDKESEPSYRFYIYLCAQVK
jgi:hypothetical protein